MQKASSTNPVIEEQPSPIDPFRSQSSDLRLLWIVTLDPTVGEAHGAGMRFLNFSRELSSAGAEIYFAVNIWPEDDEQALEKFLKNLKNDGIIAGYTFLHYSYSAKQGRWGALAHYPSLTNWVLRDARRGPVQDLLQFSNQHRINAAIVSDRKLIFMGAELDRSIPTILDWTDSMALYYWRALKTRIRERHWAGMAGFLRDYEANLISEIHYGSRASLNTVVSPIDKDWLDRVNRSKSRNKVWMNGTDTKEKAAVAKVPKRLIFSGTMDYPPNYEGALWFLDQVFPQLLAKHPETEIVIAGVNPVPQLARRANQHIKITGFVPDLAFEIARSSLYVAPLFSGGGFRNKVIEAVMQGTYLVGTPISVEFLAEDFRNLLLIANSASDMANSISDYFDHPEEYAPRLKALREIVISQFSWRGRSGDLLNLLTQAEQNHAKRRRGKGGA